MKPICILVSGMPATGKSTMAAFLSSRLGIPMFSKDGIKERLFDTLGFSSREEKVRLGIAAMEIMYDGAKACLSCGQSVILENNFENTSKDGLAELFCAYPCTVINVYMTGELKTIHQRFTERDRSPQRHRGHVVNDCYPEKPGSIVKQSMIPYEAFAQSMTARGMDRIPWDGPSICVDTTDFEKVDMESVLARIDSIMK